MWNITCSNKICVNLKKNELQCKVKNCDQVAILFVNPGLRADPYYRRRTRVFLRPREDVRRVGKRSTAGLAPRERKLEEG